MSFSKILCPTDFSPSADCALVLAAKLAGERAELVVAHAVNLPRAIDWQLPEAATRPIIDEARAQLEEAVARANLAGATRVSARVMEGPVWPEIVQLLDTQGFDLCVTGSRGHTGFARAVLGSVAEQVVRHAPCSVLTVHDRGITSFEHVLVATDFSASAAHAIPLASELVHPRGTITLLHVIDLPGRFSREAALAAYREELDRDARAAVAHATESLQRMTSAEVTSKLRTGNPERQILDVLEVEPRVDLVVLGSRGRTGIKRALLGSVAEKVVRHSQCPVLIARARTSTRGS